MIEDKVKQALIARGFSRKTLLNNRGLIGAAIDETVSEVIKKINNNEVGEKPPLGLKPKWVHERERKEEIIQAITRFLEADKIPPKEWLQEFASYSQ